jgi:DNA-binding MltR family transcriptional regulator
MASRNRGKAKLRDLSRLPLAPAEWIALSNQLNKGEHPIATAILGAVMVEHHLEELLRPRFKRNDDKTWAMLTANNGPLNSFDCKIALGYAFGIYDDGMRDDLHIVRRIRNAFAHSRKPIQFTHPAVVKELTGVTTKLPKLPKIYKGPTSTPTSYVSLCFMLSGNLLQISTRRLKSKTYRYQRKIKDIPVRTTVRALLGSGTVKGSNPFALSLLGSGLGKSPFGKS